MEECMCNPALGRGGRMVLGAGSTVSPANLVSSRLQWGFISRVRGSGSSLRGCCPVPSTATPAKSLQPDCSDVNRTRKASVNMANPTGKPQMPQPWGKNCGQLGKARSRRGSLLSFLVSFALSGTNWFWCPLCSGASSEEHTHCLYNYPRSSLETHIHVTLCGLAEL